jgi:pimeloyl-ACP methyl ester carboxylesterase
MTTFVRSATVASQGEDIYYEVAGDGEDTVVFGHGLGGNHAVWFQQVPVFAQRFRVITWDQRGFGMSTNRNGEAGPAAAANDLDAILDAEAVPRAHLVGQSMGGWAIVAYALRHPERVTSMVMADSIGGISNDAILTGLSTQERRVVTPGTLGSHPAVGPDLDQTKTFLYQQLGSFRGAIDEADMIGKLFSTRHDATALSALTMPVLCVVGSDDDLMPPAVIKEVATMLSNASVVEIADAGHSPYFEQPQAWNDAVLTFLAAV